jgi:hypothetical protein
MSAAQHKGHISRAEVQQDMQVVGVPRCQAQVPSAGSLQLQTDRTKAHQCANNFSCCGGYLECTGSTGGQTLTCDEVLPTGCPVSCTCRSAMLACLGTPTSFCAPPTYDHMPPRPVCLKAPPCATSARTRSLFCCVLLLALPALPGLSRTGSGAELLRGSGSAAAEQLLTNADAAWLMLEAA